MADDPRQQLADDVRELLLGNDHVRVHMDLDHEDGDHIAALLLPLLDRVAADAAAEALEQAADELHVQRWNADKDYSKRWPASAAQKPDLFYAGITTARGHLRARAAELRAPARTDEEN